MIVAIYGKKIDKSFKKEIIKLFEILENYKIKVIVFQELYSNLEREINFKPPILSTYNSKEEIYKKIDFLFSIGGDGTFLDAVTQVKDSGVPIIGINAGRLGFLATISEINEFEEVIKSITEKSYEIEKRTLLEIKTSANVFNNFNFALNEVTIHKHDTSSMITIHSYINDEYLNSYWADGLIISTPTGSTAYSLSVGGPIVVPNSENFIITPLAPHSMTVRPIVINDKNKIKLKVESRNNSFLVSLDHRAEILDNSVEIEIKKADFKINTIKLANQSFYKTIRNKLMWGIDKRN
ncbi:MAG TPA: NAD kinase [Bacteroidales bacterium]|nr:MAG: NAD kinase [Bacteroidetes bacterium GWF2_33_38]OFY84808.1 MAG: NAD kinase [Bacteroidetes bacterium RIFOXYA2_FULL_33_7]HBF87801.1 NAD kinase [Bacteroidales bacterium]